MNFNKKSVNDSDCVRKIKVLMTVSLKVIEENQ